MSVLIEDEHDAIVDEARPQTRCFPVVLDGVVNLHREFSRMRHGSSSSASFSPT